MKRTTILGGTVAYFIFLLSVTGCHTEQVSPYQPGPTAGKVVGVGVGLAAGNVAGAGVGVVEGTAHGVASSFDPRYHLVRYWKTEVTADGRTIQVPYDILVDQYGRVAHMPAPTGNPAPSPMAPAQAATSVAPPPQ
jgi:hypothetical protein